MLGKAVKDSSIRHYQYFTGGHYSRWEFEDVFRSPGFSYDADAGNVTTPVGEGYWTNEDENYEDFDNVITGPNFAQQKEYPAKLYVPTGYDDLEYYFQIRFKVEFENQDTLVENDTLMRFDFKYGYYDESSVYNIITLRDPFYITSEYTGDGFVLINDNITYSFDSQLFSGIGTTPEEEGDIDDDNGPSQDRCEDCGMFLEADFYESGFNNDYNIYLDYFEVYCKTIGSELLNPINQIVNKNQVKASIEAFDIGDVNILQWRGYMEPVFLDLFRPFGITCNYMNELSSDYKAPLTQVFNPFWRVINGENREERIERYLDLAQPNVLTINRYPIGYGVYGLGNVLEKHYAYNRVFKRAGKEANERGVELVSAVQTHCYRTKVRQPTPEELDGLVNLSLANGAKSILYFKWAGESSSDSALCHHDGTPTVLYYHVRDNIGPRLNNENGATEFGNLLLNLTFQDNFISWWETSSLTGLECVDELDWVELNLIPGVPVGCMLREFIDERIPQSQSWYPHYLYVVNARTHDRTFDDYTFDLDLTSPYPNFSNIRITDVEGGLDTCYSDSMNLEKVFSPGEGRLWRFLPVISAGGVLEVDETMATDMVLGGNLTIKEGCELTISSDYVLEDDIFIDSTASIVIDEQGNISPDSGNLYFSSWDVSLLIMEDNNHPKLVWGVNTWINSLQHYKIYRKTGEGKWNFLAQADSNYYIDEYYTIYGGIGDSMLVQYKVTAYGEISGRAGESGYTNTVEKFVNTGEAHKRNSGNHRLPTVFDLENNYPNPFNPETRIKFQLPKKSDISLIIYDILGSRIKVLQEGILEAGYYEKTFRPEGLASGVYICRMQAPKFNKSIKLIYMK